MLTRNLYVARLQQTLIIELKMWYTNSRTPEYRCDKSIKRIYRFQLQQFYRIKWLPIEIWLFNFHFHNVQSMTQLFLIIQCYSDHARMSIDSVDINWTRRTEKEISFLMILKDENSFVSLYATCTAQCNARK